jgi:hypothetical protein
VADGGADSAADSAADAGGGDAGAPFVTIGPIVASAAPLNLTTLGTLDWVHAEGSRCVCGSFLDLGEPSAFATDGRPVEWTNGKPTGTFGPSVTKARELVVPGVHTISLQAPSRPAALTLYFSQFASELSLTAVMNGVSTQPVTRQEMGGSGGLAVRIRFAAPEGTEIAIKLQARTPTGTLAGTVSLLAATLAPDP